jgi:lactate permease
MGGLSPLGALGAGAAGVAAAIPVSRGLTAGGRCAPLAMNPPLSGALLSYGSLTVFMTALAWPGPLRASLAGVAWVPLFPEVATSAGFVTQAGAGAKFQFLIHPGTAIFLSALLTFAFFRRTRLCQPQDLLQAAQATWRSAAAASLGIIATVCLSTLMEHAGMTQLLAQGAARLMGSVFPLVSPLVGILGAFATGSNNNSNVLFAPLQKNVAELLSMDARVLLGAQTAGGSLGSMLAPAKIAVGCSTVGLKGREGDVLRITLLYGIGIGLLIGVVALLLI